MVEDAALEDAQMHTKDGACSSLNAPVVESGWSSKQMLCSASATFPKLTVLIILSCPLWVVERIDSKIITHSSTSPVCGWLGSAYVHTSGSNLLDCNLGQDYTRLQFEVLKLIHKSQYHLMCSYSSVIHRYRKLQEEKKISMEDVIARHCVHYTDEETTLR